MESKKLYKNPREAVFCGVCAGFSEYTGLDVTIIRLLMVLLGLSGNGIILYFIAAIVMPSWPQ